MHAEHERRLSCGVSTWQKVANSRFISSAFGPSPYCKRTAVSRSHKQLTMPWGPIFDGPKTTQPFGLRKASNLQLRLWHCCKPKLSEARSSHQSVPHRQSPPSQLETFDFWNFVQFRALKCFYPPKSLNPTVRCFFSFRQFQGTLLALSKACCCLRCFQVPLRYPVCAFQASKSGPKLQTLKASLSAHSRPKCCVRGRQFLGTRTTLWVDQWHLTKLSPQIFLTESSPTNLGQGTI